MFTFGDRSERELVGVEPRLVKRARRALASSSVDFGVHDGLRTKEAQAELYAQGVSRTLDSEHLHGNALDLVPWIGGRLRWQWPACIQVAIAMREADVAFAADRQRLTWGGVWDRLLVDLNPLDLEGEIEAYTERWRRKNWKAWAEGRRPLIDPPHFQGIR